MCAGHLRGFLFVDWQQIDGGASALDYLFYFLTGLAGQAVIVFFVLSGFLVGGGIASASAKGTWSVTRYALRRIVRLEMVLVPALLITYMWDSLGQALTNGAGYDGSFYQIVSSGPSVDSPLASGFTTLLGNVSFLMTIAVPIYGTNGPLWSLANEFWYYVIFPLAWISLFRTGLQRSVSIATIAAIAVFLPKAILLSGIIWLFGYGAWYLTTSSRFRTVCAHPMWFAVTSILFFFSLYGSRMPHWFGADFSVGLTAALLVTALAVRKTNIHSRYGAIGKKLADMSYTLYLFHFPFLSFFWFCFFTPNQFQPGTSEYGLAAFALSITLSYAYIMWWCFERNTDKVRRYVEQRLRGVEQSY